jgi:hypothetical protein
MILGLPLARRAFHFSVPLPIQGVLQLIILRRNVDGHSPFRSPSSCHLAYKRKWEVASYSDFQFLFPISNVWPC